MICARGHRVIDSTGECDAMREVSAGVFEHVTGSCDGVAACLELAALKEALGAGELLPALAQAILARRKAEAELAAVLARIPGYEAEADRMTRELAAANERAAAGYHLSTYAATIHWGARDTNTPEWLDGLREEIENVQAMHLAELEPASITATTLEQIHAPVTPKE